MAQKRSVVQRIERELKSLPTASVSCVRRRRPREDCFDCALAAAREDTEEEKRGEGGGGMDGLPPRGPEKLAREFYEIIKCSCVKCKKQPCEYHRFRLRKSWQELGKFSCYFFSFLEEGGRK